MTGATGPAGPAPPERHDVLVVGAGLAGVACAGALETAGVPVRVLERSGGPGGRLASPPLHGRPVDMGAAYFTASDDEFSAQVQDWVSRGLVTPWTDTLAARSDDGSWTTTRGPQRYGAPDGLRSLVADLAEGLRIETRRTVSAVTPGPAVDGEPACAVVLAMPDPQAARLLTAGLRAAEVVAGRAWEPVIAVALGFARRTWDELPAAFVNGHPDVALIADDGSRRGDGAAVLVAHTTNDLARRHLDDPDAVIAPVTDAVVELLGLPEHPTWTHAHRWRFASPDRPHEPGENSPFHFDDDLVGVAGDGWGSPRVETAWRSGTLLGRAIAARVTC